MPKVVPEYLEQRRQQILDAAAVCFARTGFHPTTMQDICREADLSPGAVYRYFPSKESIIQAMCDHGGTSNRGKDMQFIDSALEQGSTLDSLNFLIDAFFVELDTVHSQTDCILRVELIAEAPRNEHVRQWLTRDLMAIRGRFAQLIASGQTAGHVDPDLEPESVSQVMVALFHGFITQKLIDPEMDVHDYARVMRSMFGGRFWRGPTAPS